MTKGLLVFVLLVGIPAVASCSDEAQEYPGQRVLLEKDFSKLASLLSSSDEFSLRNTIYSISRNRDQTTTKVLKRLWKGQDLDGYKVNKETINRPLVKILIAQVLIERGVREHEYIDYIKRHVQDANRTMKTFVAEALREVGDVESLKVLETYAEAEDLLLAEIAISGIVHSSEYGLYPDEAMIIWKRVRQNKKVDRDLIRKYERMYPDPEPRGTSSSEFSEGYHYSGYVIDATIVEHMNHGKFEDAITLLLPEARKGVSETQHLLGNVYLSMNPPNYEQAVMWFSAAIDLDFAPAKVALAFLYFSGHGVAENHDKATTLLIDAEQQGDQRAKEMLNKIRVKAQSK